MIYICNEHFLFVVCKSTNNPPKTCLRKNEVGDYAEFMQAGDPCFLRKGRRVSKTIWLSILNYKRLNFEILRYSISMSIYNSLVVFCEQKRIDTTLFLQKDRVRLSRCIKSNSSSKMWWIFYSKGNLRKCTLEILFNLSSIFLDIQQDSTIWHLLFLTVH